MVEIRIFVHILFTINSREAWPETIAGVGSAELETILWLGRGLNLLPGRLPCSAAEANPDRGAGLINLETSRRSRPTQPGRMNHFFLAILRRGFLLIPHSLGLFR
jgi:hypothetical protein